MNQFKPAIAVLSVVLVLVLGWSIWHCVHRPQNINFAVLAAAKKPPAKSINIKDKATHPYWGNCNKCHITVGAGKPVSKVMAGAPLQIKDKMLHEYWGNCLMCHKVIDGFKEPTATARAAALNRLTARSLGLELKFVTAALMNEFGLPNEDGALIMGVAPGSVAELSGLRKGDEIIRFGKVRVETAGDFDTALQALKPESTTKMIVYRGKKMRVLYLKVPVILPAEVGALAAAAAAPMGRNQVETRAAQLGVPKTQPAATMALQSQTAAFPGTGTLALAVTGPGLNYPISDRFGSSPYFIVFDPGPNSYRIVANPNVNDATGRGVQTGQYIVDLGVAGVVAGRYSQAALQTLHTLRVTVYSGVTGPSQDVLAMYGAGRLMPTSTSALMQPAAQQRRGGGPVVQVVY